MSPDHPLTLSASEERGRLIYAREGCAYCHTQQIRFLQDDMKRFGAPTLAWETRYDYPHLWGTRRIGPDLAREGGARSEDWQLAHLYAPRTVVRDSVMPAYRALFDGSPERPRQEARDLAAYLETLGRARELAGPEGEARAREICLRAGDEMALLAFQSSGLNANPARSRRNGAVPPLGAGDLTQGRTLYQRNCASCHGARGKGDGSGANSLRPPPANLGGASVFGEWRCPHPLERCARYRHAGVARSGASRSRVAGRGGTRTLHRRAGDLPPTWNWAQNLHRQMRAMPRNARARETDPPSASSTSSLTISVIHAPRTPRPCAPCGKASKARGWRRGPRA